MLDVMYVAVVDYGFKRTEMPNLPSAAMVYPAADYRLTLLLVRPCEMILKTCCLVKTFLQTGHL
jgi:hypothetical protein